LKNFLLMLGFLKKSKFFILLLMIITYIYAGVNFIFPWVYKYIFDKYIPTQDAGIFFNIALIIIILMFSTMILNFLSNLISMQIILKLRKNIRYDLSDRLLQYKYTFFQNTKSGDIISNIIPEIDITSDVLLYICKVIFYTMLIIFFFIILFFIDYHIGIIFILIFNITLIWAYFFKNKIMKCGKELTKIREKFYSYFYSVFYTIKEIKYYNLYDYHKKTLHNISSNNKKVSILSSINNSILKIISILPVYIGNIIIIIIGFYKMKSGVYTFGLLLTIIIFTNYIINPLKELTDAFSIIQSGWASIKKIINAFSHEKESQKGIKIEYIKDCIKIKNLFFSYDNKINILNNINIQFNKNKFITIVGETGSGKSTIINLILKLFQVNKNQIMIDNNDLLNIQTNNIREIIGIVSQDGFILNDTLKNNIDLNKTLKDNEILDLCKDVDLLDYINKLPNGLYTELAEQGKNLSGGEKQRILLARCLAKNANIIILDEATSAMDLKTERNIINLLLKLKKNQKILFIIAITHRPSFAQYSDLIYVLDKGEIKEKGTHNDLLKQKRKYFMLIKNKGKA